ncbi:hypothetical protein [Neoroseomonas soli]|uniref:Uncharacterized protein n=1 Tax=Neoroseomonas soli TaxID=1081025 RepID=A0A9X9WYK1_9PROT|nr:hypothetical protein [Neoroseomonas soli]MBR0672230.1 hypothetical protein [Neoroseomonas soli]
MTGAPPAPPRVVFEDEQILVVHRPGRSAFTVVTFGGFMLRPDGMRIWAGPPIGALGLEAIGFVAKASNWFPEQVVARAAPRVRATLRGPAVGYGYSMGGYAALKHGRLLGLDAALAVAPQVSIDPRDVPRDLRYRAHFDPGLHQGMRVRPGDLCEFPVVVADPHFAPDRRHVDLLGARDRVSRIWLPHMRHGVIGALTSTAVLGRVLELLLARDAQGIRDVLRARRRTSRAWHTAMAAAATVRGRTTLAGTLWAGAAALGTPSALLDRQRMEAERERDRALAIGWRASALEQLSRRLLSAAERGDWQAVLHVAARMPATANTPRLATATTHAALALGEPAAVAEAAAQAAAAELPGPVRIELGRRFAMGGHGLPALAVLLADPSVLEDAAGRASAAQVLGAMLDDESMPPFWRVAMRSLRRRVLASIGKPGGAAPA